MNSGFYSAFAAFAARTDALEIIGNNLANANTVGFKWQLALRSFADWGQGQGQGGSMINATWTPLNQAVNQAINHFGVLEAPFSISLPAVLKPPETILTSPSKVAASSPFKPRRVCVTPAREISVSTTNARSSPPMVISCSVNKGRSSCRPAAWPSARTAPFLSMVRSSPN